MDGEWTPTLHLGRDTGGKFMNRRTRRGVSLVEVTVASALTGMVLFASLGTLYSGMRSWIQGQSLIDAETDGTQAVRMLNQELREAMAVTVASDGYSVTYRLPQRNGNGDFIIPPLWDGVSRRALVTANASGKYDLKVGISGRERLLSRNVIVTDPEAPGAITYRVFVPGAGTITRQINVMLVTRTSGPKGTPVYHRVRESLFLRNIPSITN